ncbi:hypothetical protein [Phaeobacter sp. HF9A]|uniref:hypothetical protein n=1 Tax=Phaeobacter sp. HF9A TaxID=2721561 RepID=UPI001430C356|nr:hypothetical protein [Phaeobacter sp. HF9A]NIZ13791.1 hypothetical protein [Phaeobacter sp. HF9A]
MKPEFALSLSFDGIALLFRGAGGWRRVGTVSPEVADLPTDLAILRAKAEELTSAKLHSKLILPDAQIRYLTIETGVIDHGARIEAARIALEGTTPYAVSELAFDVSADGARTHVAAVAIETLEEAESFAAEHGFGPVSFVAAPESQGFLGEPFFGTTRAARGMEIEPDGIAVVEIGLIELPPQPDPAADIETATPDSTPAAADDDAADAAPKAPDLDEEPALYAEDAAEAELAPNSASGVGLPAAPPLTELHSPDGETSETAALTVEDTEDEEELASGPAVGFSSRRKRDGAASDLTATRTAPVVAKAAPSTKATAEANALAPVPPAPSLSMPSPTLAHTTSAPAKPQTAGARTPGGTSAPRKAPQAPARRRVLRMGLVAALLTTVAAVGGWALVQELPALWSDLKRADLVETEDPVAPPVLAKPPATGLSQIDALDSSGLAAGEAPHTPTQDAALNTAASTAPSASDNSDAALASVDDSGAPLDPSAPEELSNTDAAVLEALGGPAAGDGGDLGQLVDSLPAPRTLSDAGLDAGSGTGQAAGLSPDDVLLPEDLSQLDPEALADGIETGDAGFDPDGITALEEAAQYAATGIWQRVPEIASLPPQIHLDDVYVASIDRTDLFQDAVALPPQTKTDTDANFAAVSNPTAAGRQFDLDERGLVAATPEGTLNPDGIMVFAGRPQITPPPTPERPDARAQADAEETQRLAALSQIRPRTRPSDLVEQSERAQFGGISREEFANMRPKPRPASLKTEAQESQPATALAVTSAPQPRARPVNFANIVDRAKRNTQQAPATVSTAAVVPSIPSSASVARQATIPNAIKLRELNLIGVYGTPSQRRALVRLPSGRYVKVKVGDRIDGGHIVAIGESQLQYQKRGRNKTLTIPSG